MGNDGHQSRLNLALLLEAAYRKLDAALIERLRNTGFPDLRPAHSQVFGAVAAEGTRIGDLAARVGITQQSVSELVDALEGMGYVERRPDERDRRAKLVTFTDRGWSCIRAGIAAVEDFERQWADQIGSQRAEALREALELIAETALDVTPEKKTESPPD